jgi:hypothetical protein
LQACPRAPIRCCLELVIGAGKLDRTLQDVEALVDAYRTDDGLRYLDYRPHTPPDRLVPEDLARHDPDQLGDDTRPRVSVLM